MSETTFKTKADVLRWLEENGYQIGKTQFYEDCRNGFLRPARKSKSYTLAAVQKYAAVNARRAETGIKETDEEIEKRRRKLDVSLRKEEVQLRREEFELATRQGKFIKREEHEQAVVARAVAFMDHLRHMVHMRSPDWIDIVDGDHAKTPAFIEAVMDEIEMRMSDFAADAEFDIVLEGAR